MPRARDANGMWANYVGGRVRGSQGGHEIHRGRGFCLNAKEMRVNSFDGTRVTGVRAR